MFGCLANEESNRSNKVAKDIKKLTKKKRNTNMEKALKILMLGTGASGKTTFVKQMKILRGGGFEQKELESFIGKIHRDIYNASTDIYKLLYNKATTLEKPDSEAILIECMSSVMNSPGDQLPTIENLLKVCRMVFSEKKLYSEIQNRIHNTLPDSAFYFLDPINYERILVESYLPTNEDILHSRTPTTGFTSHLFPVNQGVVRVIDAGGQKSERVKWIFQFGDVKVVIFICDSSAFDKCTEDDELVNSLHESFSLVSGMSILEFFKKVPFLLFFNKVDLLEQKLKRVSFKDYQIDYNGDNSFEDVKVYLSELIKSSLNEKGDLLSIFFSHATNSQNFKFILDAVINKIYSDNVAQYTG